MGSDRRTAPVPFVFVQPSVTHTRDPLLMAAADHVGAVAHGIATVLRHSRLEVWDEPDPSYEAYAQAHVMDEYIAEQYAWLHARPVARLTVERDRGAYETLIEEHDLTLRALRAQIPELEDVEIVEADPGVLPTHDPDAAVRLHEWNGMWFRSWSEVCIAQALDRANVFFVPNATVRLGITQDHRERREPDFLIVADGKLGVLEVDGAPWHPPERAAEHHERDRRLREHGISVVERYDANACREMPDDIVAGFLRLLAING
jgi:hypothetical protein